MFNLSGSLVTERTRNEIYEIKEINKNGGFGVIYIGTRCSDNLPIAIKVINKNKVTKWTQVVLERHPKLFIIQFYYFI